MPNDNFERFFVDLSAAGYEDEVGEKLRQHGVCTFHV